MDLYAEKTAARARFVLVRCLGGLDYWRYGLERLRDVCRDAGVKLAVLPGDDRPDERLSAFSTVLPATVNDLDCYFRAGGVENMQALLRRIAHEIGNRHVADAPRVVPRAFAWVPEDGATAIEAACAELPADTPLAYLIVYRSAILSADTKAIEAFAHSLRARNVATLILAVASLKDDDATTLIRQALSLALARYRRDHHGVLGARR